MPNIFAEELRKVGVLIFTAAGVAEATARKVVDSLVLANLLGVDSHGIMRVPRYLQAIESGWIVPGAEAEVVRESGVAVLMKGNRAFGQVVSRKPYTWQSTGRSNKAPVWSVLPMYSTLDGWVNGLRSPRRKVSLA